MSRGRMPGQKVGPYAVRRYGDTTAQLRLRLEAGYTQHELAAAAGVSVRTVRDVERWGQRSSEAYTRILATLGRRVTAALLDDDQVKAEAIRLASKSGNS